MLSEKETRLIRTLLDAREPITAKTLAAKLGVSLRTAKTYVARINAEGPGTVLSGRAGYWVSKERASTLLERENARAGVPQTSDERVTFLLQRLLDNESGSLNIFDLCEDLYISLSTLKTDIGKVKRRVAPFRLQVSQESNRISLQGLEKDKRKLAGSLLYNEASVNFLDLKAIQRAFPDIDATYIGETVRDTLDEFHYFANDYSVVNLVLHIAITIDRIRSNHALTDHFCEDVDVAQCGTREADADDANAAGTTTDGNESTAAGTVADESACTANASVRDPRGTGQDALKTQDFQLARAIAAKLEHHFRVTFSQTEIYDLSLLMASRTTMLDYRTATRDNIEQFVGKDCLELVQEIIAELAQYYGIDLSEHEFFVRFALHIKNLLVRAKSGGLSSNPLTQQIRANCPLLYDAAVAETGTIKRRTGFDINDDEIAYIAFHLGSTLETQKQLTNKVKAVLYCPSYYDIDKKVTLFLNRYFEDDLLVTNVVTEERDIDHLTGLELLIATVPVNSRPDVPLYRINLFPVDADRPKLRQLIDSIKHEKRKAALRSSLEELLAPELFCTNDNLTTRDQVINAMTTTLVERGDVDDAFVESVFERERLSSTAFPTFAMPHAVRLCSHRSSISVMVSRVPIAWEGNAVKLVVMLSFARKDRAVFYEVFDPLVEVLSDPENVTELVKTTAYDQFIETLCDMMS